MNKKFFLLAVMNTFLILVIASWLFYKSNDKIVYANFGKLFDGFRMTKEMTQFGQKDYDRRVKKIDSLYVLMTIRQADQKSEVLRAIVSEKDSLTAFRQRYIAEQSQKIKKRIENYSKEFAAEKGYQLIISGESANSVLYCAPEREITNELLTYINKKYEGLP